MNVAELKAKIADAGDELEVRLLDQDENWSTVDKYDQDEEAIYIG